MKLYQATTPFFCAGLFVTTQGMIWEAAPIIAWSIGLHISKLKKYCESKKGRIDFIKEMKEIQRI